MAVNKRQFYQEAIKAEKKGKYDTAIKILSQLADSDPAEVKALHELIRLYNKMGDVKNAVDASLKLARRQMEAGFYPKALGVLKSALSLDKKNIDIYQELIRVYRHLNYRGELINVIKEVVTLLEGEGRTEEERGFLQELLEVEPDNIAARFKLAELYAKEGQTARAEEELNVLEDSLEKQGKVKELTVVLERKLTMGLDGEAVREKLVEAYVRLKDWKKAMAHLQYFVKAKKTTEKILWLMAETLEGLGKYDKALLIYKQLLNLYRTRGDSEKLQRVAKRIVELNPDDEEVKSLLSETQAKIAEKEAKLRGEELEEERVKRLVNKFLVSVKYGLISTAKSILDELLPMLNDIEVIRNYAKMCVKFKYAEGAEQFYRRAIEIAGEGPLKDEIIEEVRNLLPSSQLLLDVGASEAEEEEIELAEPEVEKEEVEISTSAEFVERQPAVEVEEEPAREIELEEPEREGEVEVSLGEALGEHGEAAGSEEVAKVEEEPEVEGETGAAEELEIEIEEGAGQFEEEQGEVPEPPGAEFTEGAQVESAEEELVTEEDIMEAFQSDEVELEEEPVSSETHAPVESDESPLSEEPQPSDSILLEDDLSEAEFYINQGLYDEARDVLERVLEKKPESTKAHELLQRLDELEKATEAEEMIGEEEVVVAKDASQEVSFDSSILEGDWDLKEVIDEELSEEGELQSASEPTHQVSAEEVLMEFKKGVKKILGEEEAQAHYDLGLAYLEMGLYDEAAEEFFISMKSPELKVVSMVMIGLCYINKGDPSSAIKILNEAYEGASEEQKLDIEYNLGLAFEMKNEVEEALKWFGKVAEKSPDFKDVKEKVQLLKSVLQAEEEREKEHEEFERLSVDELLDERDLNDDFIPQVVTGSAKEGTIHEGKTGAEISSEPSVDKKPEKEEKPHSKPSQKTKKITFV